MLHYHQQKNKNNIPRMLLLHLYFLFVQGLAIPPDFFAPGTDKSGVELLQIVACLHN